MKKFVTYILLLCGIAVAHANDTIVVDITNSSARMVDVVEDQSIYQFMGTSNDSIYIAYVAMQNVSSLVGNVTSANLLSDYTHIYYASDTTEIAFDSFLGGTVTSRDSSEITFYEATFLFEKNEQVYKVHFTYHNPVYDPNKVDTLSDSNAQIYFNYWHFYDSYGFHMFVTQGVDTPYIYQAYILVDSAKDSTQLAGTYTEKNMYHQGLYDVYTYQPNADIYQTNLTITRNGDNTYSIVGSVLCYGDLTIMLDLRTHAVVIPTTLDEIDADTLEGKKIFRNGQILIQRYGHLYNLQGALIE